MNVVEQLIYYSLLFTVFSLSTFISIFPNGYILCCDVLWGADKTKIVFVLIFYFSRRPDINSYRTISISFPCFSTKKIAGRLYCDFSWAKWATSNFHCILIYRFSLVEPIPKQKMSIRLWYESFELIEMKFLIIHCLTTSNSEHEPQTFKQSDYTQFRTLPHSLFKQICL